MTVAVPVLVAVRDGVGLAELGAVSAPARRRARVVEIRRAGPMGPNNRLTDAAGHDAFKIRVPPSCLSALGPLYEEHWRTPGTLTLVRAPALWSFLRWLELSDAEHMSDSAGFRVRLALISPADTRWVRYAAQLARRFDQALGTAGGSSVVINDRSGWGSEKVRQAHRLAEETAPRLDVRTVPALPQQNVDASVWQADGFLSDLVLAWHNQHRPRIDPGTYYQLLRWVKAANEGTRACALQDRDICITRAAVVQQRRRAQAYANERKWAWIVDTLKDPGVRQVARGQARKRVWRVLRDTIENILSRLKLRP